MARVVFQSRPRIKQVIRVVARAAFLVALLMPWLAILAWLYSGWPGRHVPRGNRRKILMTARLYGLWVLSVIVALVLEFLTPGMLTLLPVPW
jgi:hypothetical protein